MSDQVTTADILQRLQQDAEGHALRGDSAAAYQAITGVALARQLLAALAARDAEIAALKDKGKRQR